MAGYQTIEALRPIMHRGPVPTPVVNRAFVHKPRRRDCANFAQISRMVEMRQQGHSIHAIMREVGFTSPTIRRHTKHVQPPPEGWSKGGRKPHVKREFVMRLHRAGFSYAEIAEEAGCHPSNVGGIVKGWSKKTRRHARPTLYIESVVERVTGLTVADLRDTSNRGSTQFSKARAILCWLAKFKYPTLSLRKVGVHLGGYDRTTVDRGIGQVEEVIARLGIKTTGRTQGIVKRLWDADWRGGQQ